MDRLVPDTSVIVEGVLSRNLAQREISADEIFIHEAVISLFERLASENRSIGLIGIDELGRIRANVGESKLTFTGERPSARDVQSLADVDSLIRWLAHELGATLYTSSIVQARIAKAVGISYRFVDLEDGKDEIRLERFFDDTTMSVHLRESTLPHAKKGMPGRWTYSAISDQMLSQDDLQEIAREIIEEARHRSGFIEIERPGSTIVQLGRYRIVITRPPFSDGWEITAVRPVKHLQLEDYSLSEKLMRRIAAQAEGILIAGSPGMGKSTFAAALAEHYASQSKVVKTVEAPRDLVLPDTITQYAISHGTPQEIHDILLLSRPDYTIFDEMRNTADFHLFSDLRLAGIGFIGVVHATKAIDAIQRFVGRIELGVIPQVVDTVVFIKDGLVGQVLSLHMVVKVPAGMTEADLARPVVVANDFETGKPLYELYSYGEETVVVPVTLERKTPAHELAEKHLSEEFRQYSPDIKVQVTAGDRCIVYAPEDMIPRLIGKQGASIHALEDKLGIHIDVRPLEVSEHDGKSDMPYDVKFHGKSIVFTLRDGCVDKDVSLLVGEDYLLTAKVGKKGVIKVKKANKIGKIIADAITMGERVRLVG
jgi:ATPase